MHMHPQVCTCVMLLELTNNLALLPLIMLVLLVAKVRAVLSGVRFEAGRTCISTRAGVRIVSFVLMRFGPDYGMWRGANW